MITFPDSLTPTEFPGYYWCVDRKKLFSIKVAGELRELTRRSAKGVPSSLRSTMLQSLAHSDNPHYYTISVKGRRRYISVNTLLKLTKTDYELPLKEK